MDRMMKGFSLIELLIVVVLVSIVLGVGVPGYRQYVERANRADATTALLRLAAAQERFFIANGAYATEAQRAGAPPAGLGIGGTERGYYDLNIANPNGAAIGYTITATIAAGSNQADDTECTTFTVNERGQRTTTDGGGADTTEDCWR